MISIKHHSNPNGELYAACDEELIGTTIEGGGRKISITEGFYGGEIITEEEFRSRIHHLGDMNLMGERTVTIACEEGYVDKDCILVIGGVKHAQVVR